MTFKRAAKMIGLGIVIFLLSGCSILNPKVEFGQKEVPPFPEKKERAEEALRDAAWEADRLTDIALNQAVAANRPSEEVRPLADASLLMGSVSRSVGSPRSVPNEEKTQAKDLAEKVIEYDADYDASLRKFEKKIEPLAGKDVEGTGVVQTTQWTLLIGGAFFLFFLSFVYKVLNSVMNVANPAVGGPMGLAGGMVKFGVGRLQSAFTQVLRGGERFKNRVSKEIDKQQFDKRTADAILNLFREEHERSQDEATQEAIRKLTRK